MDVPRENWPLLFTLTEALIPYATHHLSSNETEELEAMNEERIHEYLSTLCYYTTSRLHSLVTNKQLAKKSSINSFGYRGTVSVSYINSMLEMLETDCDIQNIMFEYEFNGKPYAHVMTLVKYENKFYIYHSSVYHFRAKDSISNWIYDLSSVSGDRYRRGFCTSGDGDARASAPDDFSAI